MNVENVLNPPRWTWAYELGGAPRRTIVTGRDSGVPKFSGLGHNANIPVAKDVLQAAWKVQELAKKQRKDLKADEAKNAKKTAEYYLRVQGVLYVEACILYQCQLWTADYAKGVRGDSLTLAPELQELLDHSVFDYKFKEDIRVPCDPRECTLR